MNDSLSVSICGRSNIEMVIISTPQREIDCYCFLQSLFMVFTWGKRLTSRFDFNLNFCLYISFFGLNPREVRHVSTHFMCFQIPASFPDYSIFLHWTCKHLQINLKTIFFSEKKKLSRSCFFLWCYSDSF